MWQPLEPLLELTGLRGGGRWVAAAQEFPPQKLRNDYRAGVANSGILLDGGRAGGGRFGDAMRLAIEEWIWPPLGESNPTWMFKWPFEQNGLTKTFYEALPDRCVLLRPGCPINSPFGSFLRHFVGGTPHTALSTTTSTATAGCSRRSSARCASSRAAARPSAARRTSRCSRSTRRLQSRRRRRPMR